MKQSPCIDNNGNWRRGCLDPETGQGAPYVPGDRIRWISTAQLLKDAIKLAAKLPSNISGVVGVPRSGMIPAAAISTILHVPLYSLSGNCGCKESGGVQKIAVEHSRGAGVVPGNGPLAVIDDTVWSGAAMSRAKKALSNKQAIFGAVYVHSTRKSVVDFYADRLSTPHLLEWNFPNHGPYWGAYDPELASIYQGGVASDLDGIIVHDEDSAGQVGKPYLVPRLGACKLIVTGRHESTRGLTERHLREVGAKWERLEMLPDGIAQTPENMAAHKANHFVRSNLGMFIESCPIQAELIHRSTGRPVICPVIEEVFQSGKPTISLIIPTIGRETLRRTLQSLVGQEWGPGDEILLVSDGNSPARFIWNEFKLPGRYLEIQSGPYHDWGHTPRNVIMPKARGSHLAALDDDDIWLPGALSTIRAAIISSPGQPHVFKMLDPDGTVHPHTGTPMFVTPNIPSKLGKYVSRYGGDQDFIKATISNFGGKVIEHSEAICGVRPIAQ